MDGNNNNFSNVRHSGIVCPNCGAPNYAAAKKCVNCGKTLTKSESIMSILSIIFTLLCCTFLIGTILAVVDLITSKNGADGKGHVCSWISVVLGAILILMCLTTNLLGVGLSSISNNTKHSAESAVGTIEDVEDSSSDILDSVQTIKVGETFTTGDVTYYVKSADLNYKLDSGENLFIDVPSDCKCIKVTFSVTNNSDDEIYVSVGQFDCYADNVKYDNEFFGGGNYNDNIAPGRTAEVEGVWVIPKNSSSIEMEYNPTLRDVERVIIVLK
ncbi:MAG: DUF4352 domain-containing protein [Lachnospiraceae bacterium]|nr:DUF4352 domain-containing protein [Lachnospiraceae bacterium]